MDPQAADGDLPVPRDEREWRTDIEVHTPGWLPGGRLAVSYRRLWDHRAQSFLTQAAEAAGVEEEAVYEGLAHADDFADVLRVAGERAVETGDPVIRDTLARLVAAALHDDTRVHTISYVLGRVTQLEPVHVRVIYALRNYTGPPLETDPHHKSFRANVQSCLLREKTLAPRVILSAALTELASKGFINSAGTYKAGDGPSWGYYYLSELGNLLFKLIDDVDREIRHSK
jgi:hypothetical protein